MSSRKSKLHLIGAFAALATLALGVSCTGFFQNPVVSSLTVGPASPTIETGTTNNTVQMTAFGTNNDGSTTSNPSVSWSIAVASPVVATISSTGLVTSVSTGSATVTATSNQNPSVTGTQTVTVTVGCIQSIQVSPSSAPPLTSNNTTDTLTAQALTCNGSFDVTDVATWTSSNTSLATVAAGEVLEVTGLTTGGTVSITATVGNIVSNAVVITVSP
jgi:trimeric autotransporter adhesin